MANLFDAICLCRVKEGHYIPNNLVSHRLCFANSKQDSMGLPLRKGFQLVIAISRFIPCQHLISEAHQVLAHLSHQGPSPQLLSSRKSPDCVRLLPFKNYRDQCALGLFQCSLINPLVTCPILP